MFKNLIIIIVAIAVYLHFYPNEELNEWFSETKQQAQEDFSEIADTKAKVAPSKLISVLQTDFKKFSKNEVAYVKQVAETRDSLKAFHKEYCVEPKDNPRLRRQYQLKVCSTIDQYRIL